MSLRPLFSFFVFPLFSLAFLVGSSSAAVTVKLGSLVPVGTSYHKTLLGLGESWKKQTTGAVDVKVFAGGKAGGEAEMVALMMQNNLQAAVLTAVGLSEIEPAVAGTQNLPMAFNSLDEVDYVVEHLRPLLEERLAKKGFVVLFWTDAGWVRIFSNKPVVHPDDLRKLRLFSWAGDGAQAEVSRKLGFNPIPIETADIVPSLQTGLIDAVCLPPFFAMASQVDLRAPNMLEINWAPLVGACIMTKTAWDKMPVAARAELMASAKLAGAEMKAASRRESNEAAAAMHKRGMNIVAATPAIDAEWRQMAESAYPLVRGKVVPADVFDEALRLVAEYRAKHGAVKEPSMTTSLAKP